MKKRILSLSLLLPIIIVSLLFPVSTYAAVFRTGESLTIEETLEDLYASGGTVTIDAPVRNDLTVTGGTVNVNERITGGLIAAGGTLNLDGEVGNTIRAAGGTINVASPVRRDVVLAGGTITLDDTASISGDLIIFGGTVNIQSPVGGDVHVNGGQVTINSRIGGNVQGDIGSLTLGRQAVINGNLNYTSANRAILRDGATIRGQENFQRSDREDDSAADDFAAALTGFSLYKLIADILGSLALVYLLYRFTRRVVERSAAEPLKHGLLGLATLIVGPILGFLLLVLILPGLLLLFFYAVLLILAAFISKLLVGWYILKWWYGRDNERYVLDWKAAVLGPVIMFILLFIPVIGWFIGFVIFLIALGTLISEVFSWVSSPREREIVRNESRTTVAAPARSVTRTSRPARPATRSSRPATRSTTKKRR